MDLKKLYQSPTNQGLKSISKDVFGIILEKLSYKDGLVVANVLGGKYKKWFFELHPAIKSFVQGRKYQFLIDKMSVHPDKLKKYFRRFYCIRDIVGNMSSGEINNTVEKMISEPVPVYSEYSQKIKNGKPRSLIKRYRRIKSSAATDFNSTILKFDLTTYNKREFYACRCFQFILDSSKKTPESITKPVEQGEMLNLYIRGRPKKGYHNIKFCCGEYYYPNNRCECGNRRVWASNESTEPLYLDGLVYNFFEPY